MHVLKYRKMINIDINIMYIGLDPSLDTGQCDMKPSIPTSKLYRIQLVIYFSTKHSTVCYSVMSYI